MCYTGAVETHRKITQPKSREAGIEGKNVSPKAEGLQDLARKHGCVQRLRGESGQGWSLRCKCGRASLTALRSLVFLLRTRICVFG